MKTPVDFSDIELPPQQAQVFELLADGVPFHDICLKLGLQEMNLFKICSRLKGVFQSAMPGVTVHHLLAQEFLRRQSAILAGIAPPRKRLTDADIDALLAEYAAQERAQVANA